MEKNKKVTIVMIIIGHVICILIVIFAIINQDSLLKTEEVHTVQRPSSVPEITEGIVPTDVPQLTEPPIYGNTSEPAETPMPTNIPELTETPIATNIPELTETPIPTGVPEQTETPAPIETITPTIEPAPTAEVSQTVTPTPAMIYDGTREEPAQVIAKIQAGEYDDLDNEKHAWWFRRMKDHVPTGSGEEIPIGEYSAYYRNKDVTDVDKVIYMTIDCGYGSANTVPILETFKKYGVKATFFVTKFFIDAHPESVLRMLEDGHAVANHSVTHADLTSLTPQEVYEEIMGCEDAFYQLTGKRMAPFFRPPEGAYSARSLQITEDLGYKTVFWSIAYNDYDKKNQPGKSYVIDHFDTYHHNGAIPLMHNDSDSNKEAMDEVLALLVEQGYRFGTLDEVSNKKVENEQ